METASVSMEYSSKGGVLQKDDYFYNSKKTQ